MVIVDAINWARMAGTRQIFIAAALGTLLGMTYATCAQSTSQDGIHDEGQVHETWTDPATRLVWARKDNGKDINWRGAVKYCHTLRLHQFSDWRLANAAELQSIYDRTVETPGFAGIAKAQKNFSWHVKGNLLLTGEEWIGHHVVGQMPWESYEDHFDFNEGRATKDPTGWPYPHVGLRALCVRGPER
jgi:hypothetical protein